MHAVRFTARSACTTAPQLSCQILHRMRAGATDGLTKDQRRLHLAGKMLHDFVTGALPPGGSQLVRCDFKTASRRM